MELVVDINGNLLSYFDYVYIVLLYLNFNLVIRCGYLVMCEKYEDSIFGVIYFRKLLDFNLVEFFVLFIEYVEDIFL